MNFPSSRFSLPVGHRMKLKESKKINKYLDFDKEKKQR